MRHLLDMIAPDVVLLTDGGGVVRAALEPIVGAEAVSAVLSRLTSTAMQPAQMNGHPALILRTGDDIDTVLAVRLEGGLITGLYAVRNPEKLSRIDRETAVGR